MSSPIFDPRSPAYSPLPYRRADAQELPEADPAAKRLDKAFKALYAQTELPTVRLRKSLRIQVEEVDATPLPTPREVLTVMDEEPWQVDRSEVQMEGRTKWICSSCGKESTNPYTIDRHFWCDENDRQLHPDEYLFPIVGRLCLPAQRCLRIPRALYDLAAPKASRIHNSKSF